MTDSRIHFEKVDSSGTFRSGDIRLDVKFQDEHGNQYIWFPKWDDLQKLYAEAERVEELNPTGDKDLKKLKELKQFDLSVLNAIAEVIADTWQGDDLNRFIRDLGYETEYDQQTEHQAEFNASLFPPVDGAEGVRKDYVMEVLEDLNKQDYQLIIEVMALLKSSDLDRSRVLNIEGEVSRIYGLLLPILNHRLCTGLYPPEIRRLRLLGRRRCASSLTPLPELLQCLVP
ncbi:hypothetical protein [Halobacterium salinarum]|uniref:hypothetical protein n=1 Tax=Halobacterium salinarum TaxID=2242 RepID=UPI002553BB22|nr:hypothetical protein [Halobacterium salinarum]MDL0127741.1 hypothetical protein [Halobacterium salinarum]